MHGFSEKLLDGVDVDFMSASKCKEVPSAPSQSVSNATKGIKTTNLVQHNLRAQFVLPSPSGSSGSLNPTSNQGQETGRSLLNGTASPPPLSQSPSSNQTFMTRERSQSMPQSTFSFASIASKGYSQKSSFGSQNVNGNVNGNANVSKSQKKEHKGNKNVHGGARACPGTRR